MEPIVDLSRVPTTDLYREINNRRRALVKNHRGGRPVTCTCGECRVCLNRAERKRKLATKMS